MPQTPITSRTIRFPKPDKTHHKPRSCDDVPPLPGRSAVSKPFAQFRRSRAARTAAQKEGRAVARERRPVAQAAEVLVGARGATKKPARRQLLRPSVARVARIGRGKFCNGVAGSALGRRITPRPCYRSIFVAVREVDQCLAGGSGAFGVCFSLGA